MKITLLNLESKNRGCSNKDVMGGFGLVTRIGDSWKAKILGKIKTINLPLLSFAYLSSIFKRNGHEISFSTDKVQGDTDLVIIASSIIDYKNEIETIKKIKQETNSKVGVIGPFASFKSELYLKYADFVIAGEPENVVKNISEKSIPEGKVVSRSIRNLDPLPFPSWSPFPVKSYSYTPLVKKKPFLPVLSSRGCIYSCNYCPYKAYYGVCRQRSSDNIIKEIEYLICEYSVKGIQFRDPLFTSKRKRAEEIAAKMIKNKINLEWGCETHLGLLDEKLLDLLHKSGLRSLEVGIESSDEIIIQGATRKSSKKEHQEKIINYCDRIGIKVSAFYILGMKGETEQSALNTIKYAKKLNTFAAQFSISTPFPGTKLFEEVKEKIFEKDWSKFDSFTPVYEHENLKPEQLLKLKEKAFIDYYFRPTHLLKNLWRLTR